MALRMFRRGRPNNSYQEGELVDHLREVDKMSLVFVTGTLDCTGSWLAAKFGCTFLDPEQLSPLQPTEGLKQTAIVLVSWLHDFEFWHDQFVRAGGVDIEALQNDGRFTFVDCFTQLAYIPVGTGVTHNEAHIKNALRSYQESEKYNVLLLLDSPEMLVSLAMAAADKLDRMLCRLRFEVYATLITSAAKMVRDTRSHRVRYDNPPRPLEIGLAQFVMNQVHVSNWILSVRPLLSGAAKDVSGILRITRGGAEDSVAGYGITKEEEERCELETRYLVERDGRTRFNRTE